MGRDLICKEKLEYRKFMNPQNYFPDDEVSLAAIEASHIKPPVAGTVFIIFFACFFITGLVYTILTEIPIVIDAQGSFESTSEAVAIKAQTGFVVNKVLVKENQAVKKGEVLVTSIDTLNEENRLKLKKYIDGMNVITSKDSKDPCLACADQIQNLAQEYLQIQAFGEIQSLIQPINDISRELNGSIQAYAGIEPSISDARRSVSLAQAKLNEIKKRGAEKLLAKEVEDYNTQIISGNARIADRYRQALLTIQQQRSTLKARVAELESKLEKFSRTFTVLAPFDGKISNITVKGSGELISGGQVLMEIGELGSMLRANLQVQNKDIANIAAGSDVIITVNALPEIDYGSVSGSVTDVIKPMASAGPGPGAAQAAAQPMPFQVRVSLSKQALSFKGVESPFIAGMGIQGKIVTGHESILKRAYRKLFKISTDVASARPKQ
jgi:multidrug efflux pump subunit AcrA (membrane-fusion protein)